VRTLTLPLPVASFFPRHPHPLIRSLSLAGVTWVESEHRRYVQWPNTIRSLGLGLAITPIALGGVPDDCDDKQEMNDSAMIISRNLTHWHVIRCHTDDDRHRTRRDEVLYYRPWIIFPLSSLSPIILSAMPQRGHNKVEQRRQMSEPPEGKLDFFHVVCDVK
jgi:hypothetical protein